MSVTISGLEVGIQELTDCNEVTLYTHHCSPILAESDLVWTFRSIVLDSAAESSGRHGAAESLAQTSETDELWRQ